MNDKTQENTYCGIKGAGRFPALTGLGGAAGIPRLGSGLEGTDGACLLSDGGGGGALLPAPMGRRGPPGDDGETLTKESLITVF